MLAKRRTFHDIVFQTGILGYVFTLPYHAKFNSIFLILLIINWIFSPDFKIRLAQAFTNKFVLLLISIYVIYVLGMLHTSNLTTGTKLLVRDFSLVFCPLLLSTTTVSENLKRSIFITLLVTLLLSTGVCYYLFYKNYLLVNDFYLTFSQGHFRDNFVKYLPIRPTYLTLYILFSTISIIELIKYYLQKRVYTAVTVLFLIILYFVFTALLLSARMPLAAGLLLFIF
ncbi:hypothetical protein [Adhaeribacter pallidiroseus]|uniref:Uncharacterized protein n=1 Tax=Adhaeribacter pallidiroseus TaxID=2072847 RepID=A0A369QI69_9BACT|nr:hypothetical protein [Adhaeribacter pallidiroseus]RDC62977.1 hypothetical protein AHMF7616_01576 [Adhaeribacter pallidiroseus]